MVADMAGIEHGLAGALGGSVQRLVLAKMACARSPISHGKF
jgi:hypothetical protein